MSFVERFAVKLGSMLIPQQSAYRLARAVFATQGIGWAGPANGMSGSGEASFVKSYLQGLESPTVFDVGANIGDYAHCVLKANPIVSLHCFEPSAPHYNELRKRISDPRVRLNNVGLSDKADDLVLHKDAQITGLASINKRDLSHLNIALDLAESIKVVSGDNYVAHNNIQRIDLLKIDVEGWEMSVLNGLAQCFERKLIKCCQFEFGHAHIERREHFRDFWSFFVSRGFRMGVLKPNGKVNHMARYDEIYENYYATNYVATLLSGSPQS